MRFTSSYMNLLDTQYFIEKWPVLIRHVCTLTKLILLPLILLADEEKCMLLSGGFSVVNDGCLAPA